MKKINVKLLKGLNICGDQLKIFEEFLNGRKYIYPTFENLELAEEFGLDIEWAIQKKINTKRSMFNEP